MGYFSVRTFLVLMLLLATGCSSKPSDSEIRTQVEKVILSDGRDRVFAVSDFKKVNGWSGANNVYTADISYSLVFRVGLSELQDNMSGEAGDDGVGAFGALVAGTAMLVAFGDFKAGDKIPRQEKVNFIRTDNGWMISDNYQPSIFQ